MPSTGLNEQLSRVAGCLTQASNTFHLLANSFNTPFLIPISSTARSLLNIFPHVKHYKAECVQLMHKTVDILYLVIALHFDEDFEEQFPPSVLQTLGNLTLILHKIYNFIDSQQGSGGRIVHVFRHFETTVLLRECKQGLQVALDGLKARPMKLIHDFERMRERAKETHQEVMDLVGGLSEDETSDSASVRSTKYSFSSSCSSSTSVASILPSKPQIFHGREHEVFTILDLFADCQCAPRVAILGPGGIGKTSLASAVLQHPDIAQRYSQHRHFIACDGVSTVDELVILIGTYLDLKPSPQLRRQIIRRFESAPALLVLDNFETVWEPTEERKQAEELLALLAACESLALVITMRGAERPTNSGIRWTRPFLPPLAPLSPEAARQTFLDITDVADADPNAEKILELSGNMPLAIDLLAHMVELTGSCGEVLAQWETRKTAILSDSDIEHRNLNLDVSISLSLASPRLRERTPDAVRLLSLLALLPDGLSDVEFAQCDLPVENLGECRTALLRTSLAYMTPQRRLKVLVPIREHMQRYHAPDPELVEPVFRHYHDVLALFRKHMGTIENDQVVSRIAATVGNVHGVLAFRMALGRDADPDRSATVYCGIDLNMFARFRGLNELPLMAEMLDGMPQPVDHALEVAFVSEALRSRQTRLGNPEDLIARALEHLPSYYDDDGKCDLYTSIARYFIDTDLNKSNEFYQKALDLATPLGLSNHQSFALAGLAIVAWNRGNLQEGHVLSSRAQHAARRGGNLIREAAALRTDGLCLQLLGNYSASIECYRRALTLIPMCGMTGCTLEDGILSSWAEVHKLKTEYAEAREIVVKLLARSPVDQAPRMHAFILCNLAEIDVSMGTPAAETQRSIDGAFAVYQAQANGGAPMEVATCETMQADLFLREGDFAQAKALFDKNLKLTWGRYTELASIILEKLGDVRRWPRHHWNHTFPTLLLIQSLKTREKRAVYRALQFIGDLMQSEEDMDSAMALWTVALEGFAELGVHQSKDECLARLRG
uniref:Novel STAND NTPase 1 domain-containing protein n=1 Tax=Mycena chlorophos TaxID=658473 RepID=A0ABQ0LLK9_MYCCL|nr:predicted protein [Mycena chlorophos]